MSDVTIATAPEAVSTAIATANGNFSDGLSGINYLFEDQLV